jgi:hypothetical protein
VYSNAIERRPRILTYLSIRIILGQLVATGELIPYAPTVAAAPGRIVRCLWLTADAHRWCFPSGHHPDTRVSAKALASATHQLNSFVFGRWLESRVDLTQLCPQDKEAWEIRSCLAMPQLRLFGWFVLPRQFIVAHCKVRNDLEAETGPKWDAAIARVCDIRNELFPDFSPFRGRWFGDYVG